MAKFEIGVHAVVFNAEKQVLLAHRRDMDLWDLPGGGMDHGELPTETAIRETKEETGLDVIVERLLAVGVGLPPENSLGFLFLCRIIAGEISTGDESNDVRFFATEALPENLGLRKRAMIQLAGQDLPQAIFSRVTLPKARQYFDVYGDNEN